MNLPSNLFLLISTLLLASVDLIHMANCCNAVFSMRLSLSYDTVKHAMYRC